MPARPTSELSSSTSKAFGWPPAREEGRAGAPAGERLRVAGDGRSAGLRSASRADRGSDGWRAIERTWFGLTRDPIGERLARAGWAPEEPFEHCPRCASTVGRFEADGSGCSSCRGKRLAWHGAVRLGEYDGLLRDLICELKFDRWRPAGEFLGRALAEAIGSRLEAAGADPRRAVLVPIPTSFARRVDRGIDHTLTLARAVARETGIGIARPIRRRHGPTQWSVPPAQRWANVSRSFRWRGPALDAEDVIVLDDIRTTGATLKAACRALDQGRGSGAGAGRVWVATGAVSRWRP